MCKRATYERAERVLTLVFTVATVLYFSCGGGEKKTPLSFLTEITEEAGIDFVHDPAVDGNYYMPESIGSGGAFLDYDNDGDLDIYLINCAAHGGAYTNPEPLKNRLYRQEADGTFLDVTEASGLGDSGYGMGVAVGDIDNDGDVDVFISNDGPDALYRNNGDGTFSDITEAAGVDNPDWGISTIFLDYNLDDYLDIFVANYVDYDTSVYCSDRVGKRDYCGPQGFPNYADRLFKNNGDGTFTDVSVASGIASKRFAGLGAASFDFNDDTYPDIYVGNDREMNNLWMSQKDGTFKDEALMMGAGFNGLGVAEASMGITIGDVDNDNDFDMFMGHFRGESNTLLRNMGDIGFQDDTTPAALASKSLPYTSFGNGFFDYDHDGDLDLAMVNGSVIRGNGPPDKHPLSHWDYYSEPNLLFENDGSGLFRDVSEEVLPFSGRWEASRGLVFGDIDNDGDIDLMVTNEGGRARLYRNDTPNKGNWLQVRAIDPRLNRDAYGAKVTVFAGELQLLRLMNVGYSFCSSHDPRVHFGLGGATAVDKVLIEWPGGVQEEFFEVPMNRSIVLNKGEGSPVGTGRRAPENKK